MSMLCDVTQGSVLGPLSLFIVTLDDDDACHLSPMLNLLNQRYLLREMINTKHVFSDNTVSEAFLLGYEMTFIKCFCQQIIIIYFGNLSLSTL